MPVWLQGIFAFAFVAVVIAGALGWHIYAYSDCRNVGHSRAYCVVHFMSN